MARNQKNIKLSDIPKTDIFRYPDHYLDGLTNRLEKKINSRPGKIASTFRMPAFTIMEYAAALALLILSMVYAPEDSSKYPLTAEEILAGIPEQACIDYLAYSLNTVDTDITLPAQNTIALINRSVHDLLETAIPDDELDALLYKYYAAPGDMNLID